MSRAFYYPSPTYEDEDAVRAVRIARYSQCSECPCAGLRPADDAEITIVQFADEGEPNGANTMCECAHQWASHGAHSELSSSEFNRRARVALRIDETLEDYNKLADFKFDNIHTATLRKQMTEFSASRQASYESDAASDAASQSSIGHKRSRGSSSSDLSDVPNTSVAHNKRRRITSSPLSEDDDDDGDEYEGGSPTKKISKATQHVAVLSGVRTAARGAGKKRAVGTGAVPTKAPATTNGIGHVPKIKEEDMGEAESVADTVASAVVDQGRPSIDLPQKEKTVITEQRQGWIQFAPVENDGKERSYIILTGLKNLFQRQLPKMPREYITRLVMDRNSCGLAMIKHGYKVVAGITYRPFAHRRFIEIVFCAVSSANQVKGYGGHLMDHFKKHIQDKYQDVNYFLTYADNYAVGYFKKQGFSKDVTLDRSAWAGYIKDYEGATLLQCTLVPRVDYTTIRDTLVKQKEFIQAQIRERSSSHEVRAGLAEFQEGQPPTTLDYHEIPGLLEGGWTPDVKEQQETSTRVRPPQFVRMTRVLRALQNHGQSWPFRTAVNKAEVPDYYEAIQNPMDLHSMEQKLERGEYERPEQFIADVRLIITNCLSYNPQDSVYAIAASLVQRSFEASLIKELREDEGANE